MDTRFIKTMRKQMLACRFSQPLCHRYCGQSLSPMHPLAHINTIKTIQYTVGIETLPQALATHTRCRHLHCMLTCTHRGATLGADADAVHARHLGQHGGLACRSSTRHVLKVGRGKLQEARLEAAQHTHTHTESDSGNRAEAQKLHGASNKGVTAGGRPTQHNNNDSRWQKAH